MPKDRIGGHIDFVVTEGGRPGQGSTFVELEDAQGRSIGVGEWIDRGKGEWALRVPYAGLEQIIADLYASEDQRLDLPLMDLGCWDRCSAGRRAQRIVAGNQVATLADAAEWLRAQAMQHYPDSKFAEKHARAFSNKPPQLAARQRLMLQTMRNFAAIDTARHREALSEVARVLAGR